jgi:hypothetical protein
MVATIGIELFLKCLNSKGVYHQDEVLEALGGYRVTAQPLTKGHELVALLDAIEAPTRKGLDEAYASDPAVGAKPHCKEALAEYGTLHQGPLSVRGSARRWREKCH